MRVRLKGIYKVSARLATGETKFYYYAWRNGPRLKGNPGSAEFIQSYTDAHNKRKTPPQGIFFTLISEFKSSGEYGKLAPATKRAYVAYLKMIENEFGDMPIEALSDPSVRGEFMQWRDKLAGTPRAADYAWTTLARILSFAKNRGRIGVNPCLAGGRLYAASRTDKIWGEAEIARLMALASPGMELALLLALWTGQRQGDLLRLSWAAYDGKHIRLRQSKTGRAVVIPVASYLSEALDRATRTGIQVLTNTRNLPWTSDGFRASWGKLCKRAGIVGLTFHDLRGSAVVRLAISQATVPEIATFTGHSLKDVESILDAHYLGRDIHLAESAVRKLVRKEKRTDSAKRRKTV
jgi:integrase